MMSPESVATLIESIAYWRRALSEHLAHSPSITDTRAHQLADLVDFFSRKLELVRK